MRPVNWKRARPRDLHHAFELSIEYARVVNRRKVPELAELMGETSSTLYKWTSNCRMPAVLIPVFENACGCDFVSRYLASTRHRLVIDIPRGRKCDASEISSLNIIFANCVSLLAKFFNGKASIEDTSDALDQGMRALAWHQQNVDKHLDPELALFDKDVDQ